MSKSPLVSILVPIYNIEKYLPRCLDSLVCQTLTDIEIVCVNDGSPDGSLDILREYEAKDGRIVIVDKPNGGLPTARNAGLDVARGEYVGFVDGDDFVEPDMFLRLYEKAKKTKADVVVCGANPVPLDNTTPKWLKDVLSPSSVTLTGKECVSALFEVKGAQPFLWRSLVRREFIEENKFRLDESIVVGEDTAFQFKLFPTAKKLVTMRDKLYNYEWARPESIMNSVKFKDYSVRLDKHVKLIRSIAKSWRELELFTPENSKYFFDWAIDFIYWDILKVSGCDRARIANEFTSLLAEYGYYLSVSGLKSANQLHYEEMADMAKSQSAEPDFSVAIVMDSASEDVEDAIRSVLNQTNKKVEILLYNNAAGGKLYNKAEALFKSHPEICLRNSSWQPVSAHYNDAITTAKGKYIIFLDPHDRLKGKSALDDIACAFGEGDEVSFVGSLDNGICGKEIKDCQNGDYRKFAYRVSTIRENAILFSDYAMLTGTVFFTKYCLKSNTVKFIDGFISRSEKLLRSRLYATECELILSAVLWLLKTAEDNNLNALSERISDWINSENVTRLVSDSINGYVMDGAALTDESRDVHANILGLLYEINACIPQAEDGRALIKPLVRFISKRHSYLGQF